MTILDIILLICFVPAIVDGISKGFVRQAVQLLSIILGAWVAFHFSSGICVWLSNYLTMDGTLLKVVAFVLVVIVIIVLLNLAGNIFTRLLKALSLAWINRLLGVVFGLLKVGLILGLLIMLFEGLNARFNLVGSELIDSSKVYLALRDMASGVFPYLKSLATDISG